MACLLPHLTDDVFLQIPPELLVRIAHELSVGDLEALSLTSKRWHAAVRVAAPVPELHLPHCSKSQHIVTEARRLFPATTLVMSSSGAMQFRLWPVPALCNVLLYSTGHEVRFRRAIERYASMKTADMHNTLTDVKGIVATLSAAERNCDLVLHTKSRDLNARAAYRHDMMTLAPRISQLHAMEKAVDVLTMLHLVRLQSLALTVCRTAEDCSRLAEAIAQLPMLHALYLLCTSIPAAQQLSALLTNLTTNCASITTLGVALNVRMPFQLDIPASSLAGITALELSEAVALEGVPDSLTSLRLNIQAHDVAAQHTLARLQQSRTVALTLQRPVSLMLVPANLQSLTLVDPFDRQQIDQHEVSHALNRLTQLRKLQIGSCLTRIVVTELLLVSLPSLDTFGFRVHHLQGLHLKSLQSSENDPFWDQQPHVLFSSDDIPVSHTNCGEAKHRITNQPMYLQLPQLVARLGVSFGNLRVIQVCSSNTGQFASMGLNCSLLTTDHFPHLFGLTCKLRNCEIRLQNLSQRVYVVSKASSRH